jgi:RNase P subunit RPR2
MSKFAFKDISTKNSEPTYQNKMDDTKTHTVTIPELYKSDLKKIPHFNPIQNQILLPGDKERDICKKCQSLLLKT